MNVKIKQDKLNSLMTKYLDSVVEYNHVKKLDNYLTVYNMGENNDDIINLLEYNYINNELYLYTNFFFQFKNFFPVERWNARDFIGEWFSKKFNLPVSDVF
jgi:hypothetical protein